MRKKLNSVFSELYFDQYEVCVDERNIRYFEEKKNPLIKVRKPKEWRNDVVVMMTRMFIILMVAMLLIDINLMLLMEMMELMRIMMMRVVLMMKGEMTMMTRNSQQETYSELREFLRLNSITTVNIRFFIIIIMIYNHYQHLQPHKGLWVFSLLKPFHQDSS